MSASISFLPWVRQGAASTIRTVDTLGPGVAGHAALPVSLRLNDAHDVPVQFRLYGPGDVTGIDLSQVIRADPPAGAMDFEPIYFPAIEFDRPDFPWLFTPAAANEAGRLRPWLCLVVVRRQEGVTLTASEGLPLPVLSLKSPARPAEELPDLAESWAWAHAQVLHGASDDLAAHLAGNTTQSVSRLLCPRRLAPGAAYYACLVPAFEAGRRAGLGLPPAPEDEQALRPAWASGEEAPLALALPVYYHWTFSTGTGGDFEALASLLEARPLPDGVATRRLYVGDLGVEGMPDLGTLELETVFKPPKKAAPGAPPSAFQEKLRALLGLPAGQDADDPLVAPPIYGGRHALQTVVPAAGQPPVWLRELNLDPRSRAAAGLGVLVVQAHQEQLMASAWEQLGDARRVRQARHQGELALEVGRAIYAKRLRNMSTEALFQMSTPVQAHVRATDVTLAHEVHARLLPVTATAAAFRRLARPQGPVVRRLHQAGARLTEPLPMKLGHVGAATPSGVQAFSWADARQHVATVASLVNKTSDAQTAERFETAAVALQDYLEDAARLAVTTIPRAKPLDSAQLRTLLLEQLNPDQAVTERLQMRLRVARAAAAPGAPAAEAEDDPLSDVMPSPAFPQPMFDALRELAPDLILPGVEAIPPNTVTLLKTNSRFIEAFMVGLNHEMSRELLWRNYPTDQRGTYFHHFWETMALPDAGAGGDIPDLHTWAPTQALGGHLVRGGGDGELVLLLRGDLLRRYPNTVIYAVRAAAPDRLGTEERYPVFQGKLGNDITFLRFALSEAEARGEGGDPGWFFVLQQQPTEPRFGLDEAGGPGVPETWQDLAWPHVSTAPGGHLRLATAPAVEQQNGTTWGANAAHMAAIAFQHPFRVALHARRLLPPQ